MKRFLLALLCCLAAASVGCSNSSLTVPIAPPPPPPCTPTITEACGDPNSTLDAGVWSTYLWSPGGETTQTISVPCGTETSYTVTVTDANECQDTSPPHTVCACAASAALSCTAAVDMATVCQGTAQTFTATTSGGVAPFTYEWDFSYDGVTLNPKPGFTAATATWTQPAVGSYTVAARVTDSCSTGAQATTCTVATTVNPNPTPTIMESACDGNGDVTLDAGAGYAAYSWSTGAATRTITAAGDGAAYSVTVVDANGCSGTDSHTTTICCAPLMITINTNDGAQIAIQNEPRGFNATIISGTAPFIFEWDFGDGGTSTVEDPIYTYTATGNYTVTLTVTDSCGLTATDSFVIMVCTASLAITADTADGIKTAIVGQPRDFSGTALGGVLPYTFAWNFGDGGTSALEDPIYTYTATGTYTVTLTVTDSCGVFTITSFDITVS